MASTTTGQVPVKRPAEQIDVGMQVSQTKSGTFRTVESTSTGPKAKRLNLEDGLMIRPKHTTLVWVMVDPDDTGDQVAADSQAKAKADDDAAKEPQSAEDKAKAALQRAGLAPDGDYTQAEMKRAASASNRQRGGALRDFIMGKGQGGGKDKAKATQVSDDAAKVVDAANGFPHVQYPVTGGQVQRTLDAAKGQTLRQVTGLTVADAQALAEEPHKAALPDGLAEKVAPVAAAGFKYPSGPNAVRTVVRILLAAR